ncbi:hypothetical protein H5410_057844 [Solanum commersonii]|uniref:Integrase core domain containing protein n=1 Tax=Solanum commersonii TaxID=4109 RepID=A0A9J5WRZ6_SOLCO|nr:hypothetical protein H5410_057844 [Solanum commersonii]
MTRDPGASGEEIMRAEFYASYATTLEAQFPSGQILLRGSTHFHIGSRMRWTYHCPQSRRFLWSQLLVTLGPSIQAEFDYRDGTLCGVVPSKVRTTRGYDTWLAKSFFARWRRLEMESACSQIRRALGPPHLLTPFHALFFVVRGLWSADGGIVDSASLPTTRWTSGLIRDVKAECSIPAGASRCQSTSLWVRRPYTTMVRRRDSMTSRALVLVWRQHGLLCFSVAVWALALPGPHARRSCSLGQSLEVRSSMATLLHHIQTRCKSRSESEARVERMMEDMMDRKVQTVNNHLDAFELRVLERPASAIDLSSLQADKASLRSDVEAILAAAGCQPRGCPSALAAYSRQHFPVSGGYFPVAQLPTPIFTSSLSTL